MANLPVPIAFISNLLSVFRAYNLVNNEKEKENLTTFTGLYRSANGKTPLCVTATLYEYKEGKLQFVDEFKEHYL